MLELTVDEYANRTGVSKQAVYKQIKNNQLNTVKKSLNKKLVTIIQIDEVVKPVEGVIQPNEQNKSSQNNEVLHGYEEKNERFLQLIERFQEQNNDLVLDVKKYAEMAGQAKLLMDSEHRTKEEYFKLQQENRQLVEERIELKMKLEQLQEKFNEQEENKNQGLMSFFSKL